MQGIYTIKNTINNKLYIGSAIDIAQRFRTHKSCLKKNKHGNPKLQYSWNKYGEENFNFQSEEIIEDKKDLISIEQQWLDILWNEINLFNICPIAGSSLGRKPYEETKKKTSLAVSKAKTGMKRKPFSEEFRKKLSLSHLGSKRSKETKQKMSIAALLRWKKEKTNVKHTT